MSIKTALPLVAAATNYEAATTGALARLEAVTELKAAWHPVGG